MPQLLKIIEDTQDLKDYDVLAVQIEGDLEFTEYKGGPGEPSKRGLTEKSLAKLSGRPQVRNATHIYVGDSHTPSSTRDGSIDFSRLSETVYAIAYCMPRKKEQTHQTH